MGDDSLVGTLLKEKLNIEIYCQLYYNDFTSNVFPVNDSL